MVAKRLLSPRSVWDAELVRQTFAEAGAKESHIPRLYRRGSAAPQHPTTQGWAAHRWLVQVPDTQPDGRL